MDTNWTTEDVVREVDAFNRYGIPISNSTAGMIASWWHSPKHGDPFSLLSHRGEVDPYLPAACNREIKVLSERGAGYASNDIRDLAALRSYAEDILKEEG